MTFDGRPSPQDDVDRDEVAAGFDRALAFAHGAKIRAATLPLRLIAAAVASIVLGSALVQQQVITPLSAVLWYLVYASCEAFQLWLLTPWRQRPPPPSAGPRYVASLVAIAITSVAFGSPSVALFASPLKYTAAFAAFLLAGGMINQISMSRGSRVMLAVGLTPPTLYLLSAPLVASGQAQPSPLAGLLWLGGGLLVANIIAAGLTLDRSHVAETVARNALRRRTDEAEAATRIKSALMATVGHELRTPLTAIQAAADGLARNAKDPDQAAYASMIDSAGRMMRRLLDDLLDLSKLEAGRMVVEREPFAARELFLELMRLWRAPAEAKGLEFRLEGLSRTPALLTGDALRLRQVLNNLLSNAIKFTAAGEVVVQVSGGPAAKGGYRLQVQVSDSGPGFDAALIAALFEPFRQASAATARIHGGTGLGLAISRELARLMGGDLTAANRPGGGAVMRLEVLLGEVNSCGANGGRPTPAAESPYLNTEGLRVLVTDDHPLNRQALRILLEPLEVEVTDAASAAEAEAHLAAATFDLALVDLHLGGADGRDLVALLRSRPGPNQDTPVLAVTGAVDAQTRSECLAIGMQGLVAKPLEPLALYDAIRDVLLARPAPRPVEAA